jgi:nucleoside-diphosphate-sugar epimerase
MRVFVTGATGFVGSAVIRELREAGHSVLGLARSADAAAKVTAAGATPLLGSLQDLDALEQGVRQSEATIHTGFNHDFSRFAASCGEDERAIECMGRAAIATGGTLVVTSGLAHLDASGIAVETDLAFPPSPEYPRKSEATMRRMHAEGARILLVRLPPSVHGDGDRAFVPYLFGLARQSGVSAFVGDGRNLWSAVHCVDAASVFRLAMERGEPGAVYHACAEEALPFVDIASAIGDALGVNSAGLDPEVAKAHFGWFVGFASMAAGASSARTREQLGWAPTREPLLSADSLTRYAAAARSS